MRIILQSQNQKERRLYIPNTLLLNRLTAFLIARGLEKRKVHLSCKQISTIAQSIRAVHKRHPDWVLLDAEPSSGEKIKIIV